MNRIIKLKANIVQKSCDENFMLVLSEKTLYVLDAINEVVLFQTNIKKGTSACFSFDSKKLYLYDSQKFTVNIVSLNNFEQLKEIKLNEIKKADKANFGKICPLEVGFCITFVEKVVSNELPLVWRTLIYNEQTQQTFTINCLAEPFGNLLIHNNREENKYEIFALSGDVIKEISYIERGEINFYWNENIYQLTCCEQDGKYYNKLFFNENKCPLLMFSSSNRPQKFSIYKDFIVCLEDQHLIKIYNGAGIKLKSYQFNYAFSYSIANDKIFVADWERLLVIKLNF